MYTNFNPRVLNMKSTCMSCKFFKIEDPHSGFCRVLTKGSGAKQAARPMVKQDDSCKNWEDCGQQYFIRLGWVKSQKKSEDKKTTN